MEQIQKLFQIQPVILIGGIQKVAHPRQYWERMHRLAWYVLQFREWKHADTKQICVDHPAVWQPQSKGCQGGLQVTQFKETGSVKDKSRSGRPSTSAVLENVHRSPKKLQQHTSAETAVPKSMIHDILK